MAANLPRRARARLTARLAGRRPEPYLLRDDSRPEALMPAILARRVTAEIDGDFVVFLIGMRINRLWKPHKWFPVLMAMPKMLKELDAAPGGAASIISKPTPARATRRTGRRGSISTVE